MLVLLIMIVVQVILLALLGYLSLYFLSMMVSDLFGVPFVPTSNRVLDNIFKYVKLNKNDLFFDLGSGDGRLVYYVAEKFKLKRAVGIELNPLLVTFAKLKAKFLKRNNVEFYRQNIFDTDFAQAKIIYMFLFPEVVEKLKDKILRDCKKGTLIISHGFKIDGLKEKIYLETRSRPFSTYYYQL
jgi:SAM-dependent methyltransferase